MSVRCFRGKGVKFCEKAFCECSLHLCHAREHGKTLEVPGSSGIEMAEMS